MRPSVLTHEALFLLAGGILSAACSDPVVGRVVDERGSPVVGARVEVQAVESANFAATTTDAEGSFSLPARGMRAELVVEADGYGRVLQEVRFGDGPVEIRVNGDQQYEGIGVRLVSDGRTVRFEEVYDCGPARAAGVQPGQQLVSIDGVEVVPFNRSGAEKMIRGAAGSTVMLGVRDSNSQELRQLRLTRAKLKHPCR